MIRPRLGAIALAALGLILVLGSEAIIALGKPGAALACALAIGYALASALDIYRARGLVVPSLYRDLAPRLALGQAQEVKVTLENPHGYSLRLEYTEGVGRHGNSALVLQGLPRRLEIPPRHSARFTYQLRPLKRGTLALHECWLYVSGPWGLWEVRRRVPLAQRAHVGANLPALGQLSRHAGNQWLTQRLAEPLPGDQGAANLRSPARLLIWLDTGPSMHSGPAGGRALDHATDAALALVLAAHASSTPVGLHLNAGTGPRRLSPSARAHQLAQACRLLETVQPSAHPVDFATEAARLMEAGAGPALIVLLTRLPADSSALAGPLCALARRHRLFIAHITDEHSAQARYRPVRTDADAQAYCRAMQVLGAQAQAIDQLARQGLEVLQAPGSTLAKEVVARFARAWATP